MTEPFVTTEYGVSQLSGKQKGSERLGVTKHYPHSCWLYEQQWCTPSLSLSSSLPLYLFLPSSSPTHPRPSPLGHHIVVLFCHSLCHFNNGQPSKNAVHHPVFHQWPPPSPSLPHAISAFSERLDKDLYTIIHSQGGEGGGTRHAHKYRVTPGLKIQYKALTLTVLWYCFEWEFGLTGTLG